MSGITFNKREVQRYKADSKYGKIGELKTPEIRRMIRAHNKLMAIHIPPKSSRAYIMKLIKDNGYTLDHKKAQLTPSKTLKKPKTRKTITLESANKMFPRK